MQKILFIMPQLGGGGAERVVSTIIKHLNKKEFKVYLALVHSQGEYLNEISDDVEIINMKSKQTRYAPFEILKIVYEVSPDIVFSTLRGISLILMLLKPFIPKKTNVILREENTVSAALKEVKFPLFWKIYYRFLFCKADRIICQSEYMKKDLIENFKINPKNLIHIYNPIDFELIGKRIKHREEIFNNTKKNVVIIGRLAYQKGLDLVIESVVANTEKLNDVKVWIIGSGELKEYLEKKVIEGNVQNIIEFVDNTPNPFVWMKQSDLFLLPSRYEGLPNSLLEAATCECNIITTNHPGGTKEIMDIIGNSNRIVDKLTWDSWWFNKEKPINSAKLREVFDVNTISDKYQELFKSLKKNM